jgi:uncharacterized protein YkwD
MSNFLFSSGGRLGGLFQEDPAAEQSAANRAAESPEIDDPYYQIRLACVARINRDRAANGVGPVEYDLLSSQVGDGHCQEMAARKFLSHWNQRGLLPYHRYHLAGGHDYAMENASHVTVFSIDPNPIPTQPEAILPQLLDAHQRMMDEKPPLDGHRRNILDPFHTHVGIGLAVVGGDLAMTQIFVNRYVRLEGSFPLELPRRSIEVRGEVLQKDFGPYYCVLFYEGAVEPRTVEQLNRTYSYTDPTGHPCAKVSPWQMSFDRGRGRFRFAIPVGNCGPGYYRMMLWVRKPANVIPYRLVQGVTARVDTKNGIGCAGWVFRKE